MALRRLGALLVLVVGSSPAMAQEPDVRRALDSVFTTLGATDSARIPDDRMCVGIGGRGRGLCDSFVKLRLAELNPTPANALRADQAFRAVLFSEDRWAYAWYGLGLARIVLARAGNVAREGPLQPPGVTNEAAASHAFVRSLELDSTFLLAAEALAMAPVPREGASQMEKRVAALRDVRRRQIPLSPMAWAMMGVVERVAGSVDSAAAVLRYALTVGADSGFTGYELARALYRGGRAPEGRDAFVAATRHARSPLGSSRFDRTVKLVGAPDEVAAWDSVAATADRAEAWFGAFWDRRDVRDGRAVGETLTEHFRRIEDAWRRFRIDIPRTGRHKDALSNATRDPTGGESDGFSDGNLAPGLDATAVTDYYVDTYRISTPFRTFTLPDDQLDDRGVIFIRHGDPAARATTVTDPELELWRYDLPSGPRYFAFREVQFDGTTGAGVLTPQVATASNRQQLCAVDERLCYVTKGRETIQAANMRDEGLQSIRVGTTTDAHRRTFTEAITPVVQVYGLDRASGGAPRLVGAFALPADKLTFTTPPEAGGRAVYSVRIQLMALGAGTARTELDTVRHFATARPLGKGDYLTGVVELPASSGPHNASFVITQADGRGAVASIGTVVVPKVSGFVLSDLVLGREGSGAKWNSGETAVPLNPLNAYVERESAELYYQLSGRTPGATYTTRLDFLKAGEEDKPPKLSVAFREDARSPNRGAADRGARGPRPRPLPPARHGVRARRRGNVERVADRAKEVAVAGPCQPGRMLHIYALCNPSHFLPSPFPADSTPPIAFPDWVSAGTRSTRSS